MTEILLGFVGGALAVTIWRNRELRRERDSWQRQTLQLALAFEPEPRSHFVWRDGIPVMTSDGADWKDGEEITREDCEIWESNL